MKETWKQFAIFIIAIVLVVLLAGYLGKITDLLWSFYRWVHGLLAPLFVGHGIGHIILGVLSLSLVPLVVSAVPSGSYWLLTKKQFPYFWPVVWGVLLVLATLFMVHA
jgi:hypothetical protein